MVLLLDCYHLYTTLIWYCTFFLTSFSFFVIVNLPLFLVSLLYTFISSVTLIYCVSSLCFPYSFFLQCFVLLILSHCFLSCITPLFILPYPKFLRSSPLYTSHKSIFSWYVLVLKFFITPSCCSFILNYYLHSTP